MQDKPEFWDVYDARGRKTGRVKGRTELWLPGELHLAMEAWILNSRKEILIQRRAQSCEELPGVWGLTTGRMLAGEDSKVGCVREIQEELGLAVQWEAPIFLRRIVRTELIWDLFLVRRDFPLSTLRLQEIEVSEVRWVSASMFRNMLAQGSLFWYPEILEVLKRIEQY